MPPNTEPPLTLPEKRAICASIARGSEKDTERLRAIALDNDLAEEGNEAAANKALAVIVRRVWAEEHSA